MSGRIMKFVALVAVVVAGRGLEARQPADMAAKLSGSWVLNRDLSSGFGGRGRGRGAPSRPSFAVALPVQRGGAGTTPRDASDKTPEQLAEEAAMRQLQQISERVTIKASADSVTFVDARGERTFAINDKTSTLDVGGTPVPEKSGKA